MSGEPDAQLLKLTAMMAEERQSLASFLRNLESYVRGVKLTADAVERNTPAGSEAEADARALCMHTSDLFYWMTVHIGDMRNMMARSIEITGVECAQAEQAAGEVMAKLMRKPED